MQLTANQQRVPTILQPAKSPLGAYALLERLAEHGLIHRLETLNAYVPCNDAPECQRGLMAFAIYDDCGHVDEFIANDLGRCLNGWTKQSAFAVRHAAIELRGKCALCAGRARERS